MNKLQPIEHQNQRVLLTSQLAKAYETDSKVISYNFNSNKERYCEGKHYFVLEGDEKRNFLDRLEIHDGSKNASVLYLWTEKGAMLHAKSLNTDKAWELYSELVDNYFIQAARIEAPTTPAQIDSKFLRMITESMEQKEKQIEHQKTVISGFVSDITLEQKRQILNKVIRRNPAHIRDRWHALYAQFEAIHHINIELRMDNYIHDGGKVQNKLDFVEKRLGMLDELYSVAIKLFETDVTEVKNELFPVA